MIQSLINIRGEPTSIFDSGSNLVNEGTFFIFRSKVNGLKGRKWTVLEVNGSSKTGRSWTKLHGDLHQWGRSRMIPSVFWTTFLPEVSFNWAVQYSHLGPFTFADRPHWVVWTVQLNPHVHFDLRPSTLDLVRKMSWDDLSKRTVCKF